MRMKKAVLAKKYNFHIRKSVTMGHTYRLSIGMTEKILRSSMKAAGIAHGDKIVQKNKPAIADLTREIIETKHEVKSIRALLERRAGKFEGLTEYDQHFIKLFAREAAVSFAEHISKQATSPTSAKIVAYFSTDGELYREPKSRYCLRMEASSGRMKLITALMRSKTYVPTKTLIELTDLSSMKPVQSAVQAIKRMVHKKLRISEFIEGWQDSGYRINPNVILKKG